MYNIVQLFVYFIIGILPLDASDVRRPPSIDIGPVEPNNRTDGKVYIYRSEGEVTMRCKASGTPEPEYTWYKNLVPFDLNNDRVTVIPGTGGFIINPASSLDESYYQCVAQNTYGKAMSDVVFLQRAKNGENPPEQSPNTVTVKKGDPLIIMCTLSLSVPPPTYTWELADSIVDPQPDPFQMTERVQMDPSGNLYFANVLPGDSQGGRLYKCNQRNKFLDITTGGSHTKVEVDLSSGSTEVRPETLYVENQMIGLVGDDIIIKCFFAGFTTPNMAWKKQGGNLPVGRFDYQEYKTELHIKDLRMEDQGYYECTGSNRVGDKMEVIYLSVEEKPGFPQPSILNRPTSQNITEGDTAVFVCNAKGIPTPNIAWYINGEPIDSSSLGPRKYFSEDGLLLTIEKVCNDCAEGGTDLMNIQCNASNVHGYAYADGYLNVLGYESNTTTIVLIVVCVVCFVGVIIAVLVVILVRRLKKDKGKRENNEGVNIPLKNEPITLQNVGESAYAEIDDSMFDKVPELEYENSQPDEPRKSENTENGSGCPPKSISISKMEGFSPRSPLSLSDEYQYIESENRGVPLPPSVSQSEEYQYVGSRSVRPPANLPGEHTTIRTTSLPGQYVDYLEPVAADTPSRSDNDNTCKDTSEYMEHDPPAYAPLDRDLEETENAKQYQSLHIM